MSLSQVAGQEKVITILKRAFEQNRVPHAYLFHGDEGVGKEYMAIELAKSLLCRESTVKGESCDRCSHCLRIRKMTHPDVIPIFPSPLSMKSDEEQMVLQSLAENPYRRTELWANPTISIERIRELKRKAGFKSFEGRGRVVIILDAHQMTPSAANSLLKILEEPPDKMSFILVTSSISQMLDTIRSRCQPVRFALLSQETIEKMLVERDKIEPEKAQIVGRIAFGNYQRACELLEENLPEQREFSVEILRAILKTDFDRLTLVESLVRDKEKLHIKELLGLLLLWLRDALILSECKSDSSFSRPEILKKLVNIDKIETLEKFIGAFQQVNYDEMIFEIDNALDLINRNVNLTLILVVLFDNMRKYLRRT